MLEVRFNSFKAISIHLFLNSQASLQVGLLKRANSIFMEKKSGHCLSNPCRLCSRASCYPTIGDTPVRAPVRPRLTPGHMSGSVHHDGRHRVRLLAVHGPAALHGPTAADDAAGSAGDGRLADDRRRQRPAPRHRRTTACQLLQRRHLALLPGVHLRHCCAALAGPTLGPPRSVLLTRPARRLRSRRHHALVAHGRHPRSGAQRGGHRRLPVAAGVA